MERRWSKKEPERYRSKFTKKNDITPANVHDSQSAPDLIENLKQDTEIFADSAYHSDAIKDRNMKSNICAKGNRGKKLTDEQKESNRSIARIRSRVEHVFGDMKSFGGNFIRGIGLKRAELSIFLSIFTYNLRRFTYL